jgi:hypothetical protein
MPVLYCGVLLYYFFDISGSLHGAKEIGLSPTLLGLAVVGLLFCIPLVIKIRRIFAPPPSPGSGPDSHADEGGFDADAAIARYVAQRSAAGSPAAPPARKSGGPGRRASFGRKSG